MPQIYPKPSPEKGVHLEIVYDGWLVKLGDMYVHLNHNGTVLFYWRCTCGVVSEIAHAVKRDAEDMLEQHHGDAHE